MTAPRTNASRDQNHVTTLMGVSTADGITPVPVEVDPTTGQLQTNAASSGGSGSTTTTASGSISAQNSNPAGTADAGSTVEISVTTNATVLIQQTGSYSGAVFPYVTVDGVNWIKLASLTNVNNASTTGSIANGATGIWQANVSGALKFRVSADVYSSGTPTFTLIATPAIQEVSVIQGSDGTRPRTIATDSSGNVNVIQNGTWTLQPGNTANTTPWLFKELPWSVSSQTALTTVATVSSAAGQYGGGSFINLNSGPAYLQFFDTTGAVTLGVTVPTFVQPIPANATPANGAAFVFALGAGVTLANGLKVAATTTATGATTVPTALTGFVSYR